MACRSYSTPLLPREYEARLSWEVLVSRLLKLVGAESTPFSLRQSLFKSSEMPGAISGRILLETSRASSIREVCLGMEEDILKESRLDWVEGGLVMGTRVVSEGVPSFNCWFSRVSQKISTSRSSMHLFASSTFSRSYLLLFSSSRTMFMLSINRSEIEESHPPLPFLKEGTGSSFSSTLSSIFLILEGDSIFLGEGGLLLFSSLSCSVDRNSICLLALSSSSLSCFTCFLSYCVALILGSSLTTGRLVMKEALVAQVSVDRFSSMKVSLGLMQAIIRQQLFPPIDCFRMDVSFESRQGTYTFSSFFSFGFAFSERMLITCLRVNKDLFISMLSLASFPSVPVMESRSEPARSTSSILLERRWDGSVRSKLSILTERMEWLREDCRLSLWVALMRFFSPAWKCRSNSASFLHSNRKRFSTVNCSSLLHRSLSPQICAVLISRVLLLREEGLSRSQIFSLQIWRKETETVQLRTDRSLLTLSNNARVTWGMMPLRAPISCGDSSPCMVKVLPEPVCPYAKMVLWYPYRALETISSIPHCPQTSSCPHSCPRRQSKRQLRR